MIRRYREWIEGGRNLPWWYAVPPLLLWCGLLALLIYAVLRART